MTDRTIPTQERAVPVRVYHPAGVGRSAPCVMYMHGGGFTKGDLDSSDSVAWGFAVQSNAIVVSVDYRLTPEHPFPAAFNDCWGVLCWLAAHGAELGIDTSRIAIAGDSAGARLSAGLALKARDAGGPALQAVAMIYGNGGMVPDLPSAKEFAEGFGLTTAGTTRYAAMLFPTGEFSDDPYAWPVRARDHSGLPPTLVHPAELDPGRDSARHYAGLLALAGSPVTFHEAKGMIHGFMRARARGPAAQAEYDFICDFLRDHLA